jgi:tetratricopeptide (TPR) repeat protein
MRERAFGADHPAVANTLTNLGALFIKQERYAAAEPVLERALDIRERKLGGEHDHVATTLYYLAVVHRERGSTGTAERLFERSLQIREKRLGSEHPDVAISLTGLGSLYYEAKKNGRSIECLERARAICEAGTCGSMTASRLRFALARALWDRGADKGRALELARLARDEWAGLPDTTRRARLLAEADAWLRARARHR